MLHKQVMAMKWVESEDHARMLADAIRTELDGMRSHDFDRECGRYCDTEYFERAEALAHLAQLTWGRLPDVPQEGRQNG